MNYQQQVEQLRAALAAPFDPCEVRFKPAVVSGNRALALAYVDARVICDRLDSVLGVTGWQDSYGFSPMARSSAGFAARSAVSESARPTSAASRSNPTAGTG
jgi:hypothetical protein